MHNKRQGGSDDDAKRRSNKPDPERCPNGRQHAATGKIGVIHQCPFATWLAGSGGSETAIDERRNRHEDKQQY